ncbi:hypothetical protein B0H11DRAFT_2262224 [Mycena galericulata]|nr:hypothetical protein B0H11DRAFT_2262224 [Mycena galericulata]
MNNNHGTLAPAAPGVAGASAADLPAALAALDAAVLTFTSAASRIATTAVSDMYSALLEANLAATEVSDAAVLVQQAATHSQAPVPAPAPAPALPPFVRTTGPWIAGQLYGIPPLAPLTAVPDNGEKWFAITRGRYVGLTNNSAISLNAVTGVSGALSGRRTTQAEALAHFNSALQTGAVAVIPSVRLKWFREAGPVDAVLASP